MQKLAGGSHGFSVVDGVGEPGGGSGGGILAGLFGVGGALVLIPMLACCWA